MTHPREARSKISTGILAHRSLVGSRYIEDYDFSESRELNEIIDDPGSDSFLLFPTVKAQPVSSLRNTVPGVIRRPVNIVVIEGTWSQAQCMLARSQKLKGLQSLTLDSPRRSRFKIRTQPNAASLSTMEAIAYALNDLGEFDAGTTEDFLTPFLTMVERQIDYQKRNNPRYRRKWESVATDGSPVNSHDQT